nr:Zgc:56630 [Danio rerio]
MSAVLCQFVAVPYHRCFPCSCLFNPA